MSPANSDKPDRRPPYQHAADAIRREIKAGRFKPGEQLPSYKELQERFNIASMTARSALGVLRDEGLVYTVQGRGSFVADKDQFGIDYTAPTWYLQGEAAGLISEGQQAEGRPDSTKAAGTLTELLTALRDEIRTLSAEHQQLRKEVEELKAQRRTEQDGAS
ncbi:GntR family transcriptional regulator [Streptomyces sp. NPDC057136]|uniref:GntR family transcriptional regulator n=1 Tax=Streptomyces sp. NPDC057136 TaxID=3346029 RepID=UPI003644EA0E